MTARLEMMLHEAIAHYNTEALKILFDEGFEEPYARGMDGAINFAAQCHNTEALKILFDKGLEKISTKGMDDAILSAALNVNTEALKILLDRGFEKISAEGMDKLLKLSTVYNRIDNLEYATSKITGYTCGKYQAISSLALNKLEMDIAAPFALKVYMKCMVSKVAANLYEATTNFISQHSTAILTLGYMLGSYAISKQAYVKYIAPQKIEFLSGVMNDKISKDVLNKICTTYLDPTELDSTLKQEIDDGGTLAGIFSASLIGLASTIAEQWN